MTYKNKASYVSLAPCRQSHVDPDTHTQIHRHTYTDMNTDTDTQTDLSTPTQIQTHTPGPVKGREIANLRVFVCMYVCIYIYESRTKYKFSHELNRDMASCVLVRDL